MRRRQHEELHDLTAAHRARADRGDLDSVQLLKTICSETITLKDGSANTVGTIAQNKAAYVANIAGTWAKICDFTVAV